jgi:hypothetical protein
MARLGQGETGLSALHPEPVTEHRSVLAAPVRRVGVHLGVQRAQLVFVPGCLCPIEPPERYVPRGHGSLLSGLVISFPRIRGTDGSTDYAISTGTS